MNTKSTWVWMTIAAILFAAVFGVEKFGRRPPPALKPLLPELHAAAVTSVEFTPAGQFAIRVERTNGTWQLVKPVSFPAQSASIEALLNALQQLAPAQTISSAELRQHANTDAGFGFENHSTLTLQSGPQSQPVPMHIGNRTAPGDGVYVQVVGGDSVYVVDAQLLRLLPRTADDWRDTALVDLRTLVFDRISVSNATTVVQLQQPGSNQLWRLTFPLPARADNERLVTLLQRLHATRIKQFVPDNPALDPDAFGFQTPELELSLALGTNILAALEFGKSPTNDSTLIYARRLGWPSVFTVERQAVAPWHATLNDFRDPHLLTRLPQATEIEVSGADAFTLQFSPTNGWQFPGAAFPVDQQAVREFLLALQSAPIQQYRDSITAVDLPQYGLAEPRRIIKLRDAAPNGTNTVQAELSFGPGTNGLVYVRRADENPVYAINNTDYAPLAAASWQFRERQLWRFAETNAVRLTLQRGDRKSDLRRTGVNAWAVFPPEYQVNGSEVEKIVGQLGALRAEAWIDRGDTNRAQYGFTTNSLHLSVEMKDGVRHEVEFGGATADGYPYAAIKLAGETWFFEFPWALYKRVEFELLNRAAFPP